MNKFLITIAIGVFFASCNKEEGNQPVDGKQIDTDYQHGMTMITPATQWREGLPSGNGIIGALVYGRIHQERILFNHNKLWYGGKIVDVPDVSTELPVVRNLMLEGNYVEANDHYTNKLKEKGMGSNARYHPAFDVLLTTETNLIFHDYRRTLNFETGEVEVTWRDGDTRFSRRLFVSIPDDISVMTLDADLAGAVSGEVTLDIHDLKDAIDQNGQQYDPGFKYEIKVEGDFVIFSAEGTDGGEFGAVMRVVAKNGSMEAITEQAGRNQLSQGYRTETTGKIIFDGTDDVLLLISAFANEPAAEAVVRIKQNLSSMDEGYATLFERHKSMHAKKFNSMAVNINPSGKSDTPNEYLLLDAYKGDVSSELTQRLFDYGRYLLISSSRGGGYPPNLQGIWNGDYRPPWSGFLGLNENLQMAYWQGLSGNMPETMMGFYDYFDSELDNFRFNAKQLWGTRGIFIPPFMSPESGIMRHTAAHVVNWTDAAGWLASYYYDYYLFTGDKVFLKDRAVPFMKEVALFYEDFIVKDENGKNMFFPSQSPENQPKNLMIVNPETGREKRIKVQINSTIAVAISKEIFTNLVTACEMLDIEQEGVMRWKAMLADMPDYQINEDGALREWMHPDFADNYEHRHQSHIYPLFPGLEVTEESNPEIYEAAKVAIEKRLRIGLKSQTGWSLAHMANVYARLGDGERAEEALDILSRCCLGQNLFTYHNDWRDMGVTLDLTYGRSAPFQMDANFGIPAAITEMLCSSTADMLRILPALPQDWTEGSFRDVLTRVGVSTSASWDLSKKEVQVTFVAGRDTSFELKLPAEIETIGSNQKDSWESSEFGFRYLKISMDQGQVLKMKVKLK